MRRKFKIAVYFRYPKIKYLPITNLPQYKQWIPRRCRCKNYRTRFGGRGVIFSNYPKISILCEGIHNVKDNLTLVRCKSFHIYWKKVSFGRIILISKHYVQSILYCGFYLSHCSLQ